MAELAQFGLIVAGILALMVGGTILVNRIVRFYMERFNLSIWPGMVFLTLSLVCGGYAGTALAGKQGLEPIIIIALFAVCAALLILTMALDIRRAGVGWGLLALSVQLVLALCFVLVTVAAVFWFFLKRFAPSSKS